MATQRINISIANFASPDGTTNNIPPALSNSKGTNTAPNRFQLIASFDASTQQGFWSTFVVPNDYLSGGTVRLEWTANATTGNVVWGTSIGAITPADADTPLEHNQATATTATTSVNTTEARRLVETTITPAADSMAAGDTVTLFVYRDAANGSDTCSVAAELRAVAFDYTS